MTIGEKVRYFRKKKNLTQSALSSSHLTRNMISLIESDSASPSIETIRYISKKLGVDPGVLISEEISVNDIESFDVSNDIRTAYAKHKYKMCLDKYNESISKPQSDEIFYILADCCSSLGVEQFKNGTMQEATTMLSASLGFCEKTILNTDNIKKTNRLYLNLINFYFGRYVGDFIDFFDDSFKGYENINEILYVYCLKLIESGDMDYAEETAELPIFTNESYVMHINAKCEQSRGNYSKAKEMLSELLNENNNQHNAALLYNVYADLEYCCTKSDDYKNAYQYAKSKNSLYQRLFLEKQL